MLTPRLEKIISFVEDAGVVADIGCDHGYAALALIEQGRAKKVIAADISAPSLQKAEKLATENGMASKIDLRCGDGLSVLEPGEADVILLAGMGGMRIWDIIKKGEECAAAAKDLVLSPNRNEYELRKYLCENGFAIIDEALAYDNGRYYQIVCVRQAHDGMETDGFYYFIGRKLIENNDPLLKDFLEKKIEEAGHIVKKAQTGVHGTKRVEEMSERKRRMEEVLRCL